MPIVLDDSLDPSLYPLAWLVGEWEGDGAIHIPGPGGSPVGRRIEQRIRIAPDGDTLTWHMRTWVLDAPVPTPPTAVFYDGEEPIDGANSTEGAKLKQEADAREGTVAAGEPVRELIIEEHATWRTAGLLPGQDQAAATRAKPGSPESFLSHMVTLTVRRRTGVGELEAEHWAGEVRGPRIQLAARDLPDGDLPDGDLPDGGAAGEGDHGSAELLQGTRMFGLVGGHLMWLQEMGPSLRDLSPYLSVELHRGGEQEGSDHE